MNSNVRKNIAKNISDLRKQNGLTQSDLGEKLSFSDKTVSKWEIGDSTPDIEVLCRICDFFNISLNDITKENAVEKSSEQVRRNLKNDFVNHLLMMFLSIIFVLLTATVIFVSLTIVKNIYYWKVFVWAVPFCSWVFYSYTKKQLRSRTLKVISLSVVVWTILGSIYVQLLRYNLWPIFLLGAPLQMMILLSRFFRK